MSLRLAQRAGRLAAQALVIGLAISLVIFAVTDWKLTDAGAYWEAGVRLRAGEPLYPPIADAEASSVYRYSPWFAWAAVPFTFLPPMVAGVLWSAILVGASLAAVAPLARHGAWLQAAFFGSVLIGISAIGNAQPLIVAALMLGVERRSGPLWIALAASLKAVPLLFALVYLGRRQWWRFGAAVGLTALLLSPLLLYSTEHYVTTPGAAALLARWPGVYVAVALVGVVTVLVLARTRYRWLAAGTTAVLALPRFFVYDVTFLLPGVLPALGRRDQEPPRGA